MKLHFFLNFLAATLPLFAFGVSGEEATKQPVDASNDPVPLEVRQHWMQKAIDALDEVVHSPCPFGAFGSVIVDHSSPEFGLGRLICVGANLLASTGDPVLHGETAAINNCTKVLSSPPHSLKPAEILKAWSKFSLYTTAEPCPMCASAIAWSPFAEYIYATSMDKLIELGWDQPSLSSKEVISRFSSGSNIRVIGGVLAEKTDHLFAWQYKDGPCPSGCMKTGKNQCQHGVKHADEL